MPKLNKSTILPIFLATAVLFVMNLAVAGAQGPPSQPSSFWGIVTVNGANVPDGTTVTAWINGVQQAQASTQTYQGNSVYSIAVPNGNDGDTITFQVDGVATNETGTWQLGGNTELNLTATSTTQPTPQPPQPTVTPPPPPPTATTGTNVVIPIISAGDLSVDWTGVTFPETSIAGRDVLAFAITRTWTVSDTTNIGAGWHVTIVADDHLRGEQDPDNLVIEVGATHDFKVACSDSDVAPAPGASVAGELPTCPIGAQAIPNADLGEAPLTMLSAAQYDGRGAYDFIPRFQLLVPGTTVIDVYRNNIFVDVIAGP